jgi:hypothetical protein
MCVYIYIYIYTYIYIYIYTHTEREIHIHTEREASLTAPPRGTGNTTAKAHRKGNASQPSLALKELGLSLQTWTNEDESYLLSKCGP